MSTERVRVHAVVFTTPDELVGAAEALRHEGFAVVDAHTPFAIHGLDEALGYADTRLGWVSLGGGVLGLAVALLLQLWIHTVDWPLNIGGKSDAAWQALVPVAFEVTVLFAAFATVGFLFISNRLRPGSSTPPSQPGPGATDDELVLLVEERDGGLARATFLNRCHHLGAREVREGWRVR